MFHYECQPGPNQRELGSKCLMAGDCGGGLEDQCRPKCQGAVSLTISQYIIFKFSFFDII